RSIYVRDFPRDRSEDFRHGLYRFDRAERIVGCKLVTNLGQFNIDHVAQLFLRMIGDSDHRAVAFDSDPFVILTVVQTFGNVCHGAPKKISDCDLLIADFGPIPYTVTTLLSSINWLSSSFVEGQSYNPRADDSPAHINFNRL